MQIDPINKRDVEIIQVIADRMYDSRQMCQFSRVEAARMLGIPDGLLTKIEAGTNVWHVPMRIIYEASVLYDVSTDYLFGLTSDWELSEEVKFERTAGMWANVIYQQQMARITADLAYRQRKQDGLTYSTEQLLLAIDGVRETLARFKELNDFDELPIGSQLQHRVAEAVKTGNSARRSLVRCKAIPVSFLPPIIEEKAEPPQKKRVRKPSQKAKTAKPAKKAKRVRKPAKNRKT